jgi:hypothetical protein
MRLLQVALAVGGLMSLSLVAAHADTVYDFTISGTETNGSGTITVGAEETSGVPADGYVIGGVTGTINGESITGLANFGGSDDVIYLPPNQPGGYSIADNFGIALALSDGDINFSGYSSPSTYLINSSSSSSVTASSCGIGGCSSVDSFTLTLTPESVSATPLPAALPLFAGGLGMLGLFSRRKKRMGAALAA